jgi:hypothetical protein
MVNLSEEEKNVFKLIAAIILIVGVLFVFVSNPAMTPEQKDKLREQQQIDSASVVVIPSANSNGHICAQCGKTGDPATEISSTGDVLSGGKPFYVCSYECANSEYEAVERINNYGRNTSNNSTSNSTSSGDYSTGNDGRVYENAPCSLCGGTGIERSGTGDSRTCPACDGKGHQSY